MPLNILTELTNCEVSYIKNCIDYFIINYKLFFGIFIGYEKGGIAMGFIVRFFIGALGGLVAALSKIMAIDVAKLNELIDTGLLLAGQDLRVSVLIYMPILILLGGLVAAMIDENVKLKIFAIGVSAPALIAPWMSADANIKSISNLFPLQISTAYAADGGELVKNNRLEGLKYLFGIKQIPISNDQKYWVIVGSHRDLSKAKEQAETINKANPNFKAFVGKPKDGNPYFPTIIGGKEAYVPEKTARKLKFEYESNFINSVPAYLSAFPDRVPDDDQ